MERSSFRARLFFIAGPAAAIVWSVYAAILTADARQRATECDSGYRQQVRRVEAAKRRFARARNEALLAMRRAGEGAAAAPVAGMPVPASAPLAGGPPVNAIAVVNGDVPVAPGAETAAVLAETALVAEAQAHGAPADPAVKGAAVSSAVAVAAVAAVAASVPKPAESVTPADAAVAVARAAANERAQLIGALRERLGGIEVQVDEIRLGSAREDGEEWVRTVRIQLSGRKDLVKKAVASLKTAAPVREMNAGKLEPSPEGDTRTTITGTLRAMHPAPARG